MSYRIRAVCLVVAWGLGVALVMPQSARAHETDQFAVPAGQEMADIGDYINEMFASRLSRVVERINRQIDRAIDKGGARRAPVGLGRGRPDVTRWDDAQAVLERCYSPDGVAEAVWQGFGSAVDIIEILNIDLHTRELAERYPGQLPAYRATDHRKSIYDGLYLPVDPRTAFRLYHATSFQAFGVYMGADKIGHFTDMGYHYFRTYRQALADGKSEREALAEAVKLGTDGPFSEKGVLGYLTAGAYSNADLASNYVGGLFYRNLTEPVMLRGQLHPPLLERDGDHWRLAAFVTDDPQFMARYITDHFDEALNPSRFEPMLQGRVRARVAERCASLRQWYGPYAGDQDPQQYFEQLVHALSTYFGDDYGHSGRFDELVGLWNTCSFGDAAGSASGDH